jgi:plastocyanin
MHRRTARLLAVAIVVGALGLAGCGDDDDDESSNGSSGSEESSSAGGGYGSDGSAEDGNAKAGGGGGSSTLRISADPGGAPKFDRESLSAKAGQVTVVMKNPSSATAPHAVEIEGQGVEEESEVVEPGGTASVSATLEPGTYVFYCPVGNHQDAGMEGELTVE